MAGGYNRVEGFQPVGLSTNGAAVHEGLAQALGDFQRIIDRTATPVIVDQQEQAGAAAGAAGAPALKTGPSVFAKAYNRGAIAAYEATARNDARARLADLEATHADNPEAFQQSVTELRRGMSAELEPAVANVFLPIFDDMATGAGIRVKARFVEGQTRKNQAEVLSAIDGMAADAKQAARDGNLGLYGKLAGDMTRYVQLNARGAAEGGTGFLDPVQGEKILRTLDAQGDEQIVLGQFERELNISLDRGKALLSRVEAGKDGGLHLDPELRDQLVTRMSVLVNRKEADIREAQVAARAASQAESAALDDAIDNSLRAYKLGFPIPGDLESLAARVSRLPSDDPKRVKFREDLTALNYLNGIGYQKMPPTQQRDVLTTLAADAQKQGASPGLMRTYELARDIETQQASRFREDPFRLAIDQGITSAPPLAGTGEDLRNALVARADAGRAAGAHYGQPVPGFTQDEIDQLGRQYRDGDVDAKIGLVGLLNETQGQKQARAVFEAIDKQGSTMMGLTGVLMQDSPTAAKAVAKGEQAIAAQPEILPAKADFAGELPRRLGGAYGIGTRARATIEEGIKAAYAGLAADKGDLSGVLDTKLLDKAVDLVTGGTVDWNGSRMPAPRRGVTQDRFEDWARHVGPADFANVAGITPDQAAQAFHGKSRLVGTGPGTYAVMVDGPDDVPRLMLGQDGKPLTIRYRDWKPLGGEDGRASTSQAAADRRRQEIDANRSGIIQRPGQ